MIWAKAMNSASSKTYSPARPKNVNANDTAMCTTLYRLIMPGTAEGEEGEDEEKDQRPVHQASPRRIFSLFRVSHFISLNKSSRLYAASS